MKLLPPSLLAIVTLFNAIVFSGSIKASEPTLIPKENSVSSLFQRHEGQNYWAADWQPTHRPEGYGQEVSGTNALDGRCDDPGNPDCILLRSKEILIKYCIPTNYSQWWVDFLRGIVDDHVGWLHPEGFNLTKRGIRVPSAEFGCPDPETYDPGTGNIYITYGDAGSSDLGLTRITFSGGDATFRKTINSRITIDDSEIWDWLERRCGGFTWAKYESAMISAFFHELYAHAYQLGHNPEGDATHPSASCPRRDNSYKSPTPSEIELLEEYQP